MASVRSTPHRETAPLEDGEAATPTPEAPSLASLSGAARARVVRFIVTSTLERGAAPMAVIGLYADVAGDPAATRYVDQRFTLKQVPHDWGEVEDHVLDLEAAARQRGVDLASAWRRASDVAMYADDPLEQLARLAGARANGRRRERSIFDDPEDLDELEADVPEACYVPLQDRSPEIADLALEAQERLHRFAVEEVLEHGLPPAELLELYRGFEVEGDERSRQYLDRVFVERNPPADWLGFQQEALAIRSLAERSGHDAGRLYADVRRTFTGITTTEALQLVVERLQQLR